MTLVELVETVKKREAVETETSLRQAQGPKLSLVELVETRKKREQWNHKHPPTGSGTKKVP